jgi:hypothetical protein
VDPDQLGLVARHVMKLLVERRFAELEEATGGVQLSAEAIEDSVDDVGGALVMPPDAFWRALNVTAVRNRPGAYDLIMDLWTKNGRSRHVVDLTIWDDRGRPVIEVNDITLR